MKRPIKLAYASLYDSSDIRVWSGSVYFIARALEMQGVTLDHVDQLQYPRLLFNKAINRLYGLTGNQGPLPVERSMRMAERFAREIGRHLMKGDHHAIFSPSSIPLALLNTGKPKVFYTDATFADMLEQYPEFGDYPSAYVKEGHDLEREALVNCDLAIYASRWAADSAINRYGAHPDKVRVVPFGSNLELNLPEEMVTKAINSRPTDRCELLFLGVNWVRKGGPLAVEVVERMNAAGLPTTLTVVGCEPPADTVMTHVNVLPFIDKTTAMGQRRLANLLLRSHFLLLPSTAECFGIVHSEASSMGVPSLARNVGGVGEAVREGRNGFLFPADAGPAGYVDRMLALMKDRDAYRLLAHSAYQEHRQRLNWEVSGAAIVNDLMALTGNVERA